MRHLAPSKMVLTAPFFLLGCLLIAASVTSKSAPINIVCLRQGAHIYKCSEENDIQNMSASPAEHKKIVVETLEEEVSRFVQMTPEERRTNLSFIKSFLKVTGTEMFPNKETGREENEPKLASRVLSSMERLAASFGKDLSPGTNLTIQSHKILIRTIKTDPNSDSGTKFAGSSTAFAGNAPDSFEIPPGSLRHLGAPATVTFVEYEDIGRWMQSVDNSRTDSVNTHVISASVQGLKGNLTEPVRFTMAHLNTSASSPRCSFWQPTDQRWLTNGCAVEQTNRSHTSCRCRHLTSFAVLMTLTLSQEDDSTDSGSNSPVLNVISNVLLSLSVTTLLLSLITFASFSSLACDRNTIHIHLTLCLACGQLLFLLGVSYVEIKTVCAIIAGLLHFLFLSAFCWMLVEGIQIYLKLVVVFEFQFSWIPIFFAIGYGVPAIIVVVSACVNSGGYGTYRNCWLSTEKNFHWSFVGPVLVILAFNTVMLFLAMWITRNHLTRRQSWHKSDNQKMSVMIKGCASMSVLLGTGWLFGTFQFGAARTAMAYIFTVVSCAQGIFIFAFHCLGSSKVRKEYSKALRKATWMPMPVRQTLYRLIATPSTPDLEVASTSGFRTSSTFTSLFKSPPPGGAMTLGAAAALTHTVMKQDNPNASADQKTLQQDKSDAITDQKVLQQDESVAITDQKVLQQDESYAITDQKVLQQDESDVITDQKVLQQDESDAITDQNVLQQDESHVITDQKVLQQDKSDVITDQKVFQQDKSDVITDQKVLQQDESDAIIDQNILNRTSPMLWLTS